MAAVQYVNVQHTKCTRVHLCRIGKHHKLYTKVRNVETVKHSVKVIFKSSCLKR